MLELDKRCEATLNAQAGRIRELEAQLQSLRHHYNDRVGEIQDMQDMVDQRDRALKSVIRIFVPNDRRTTATAYVEGYLDNPSLRGDGSNDDVQRSSDDSEGRRASPCSGGGCAALSC